MSSPCIVVTFNGFCGLPYFTFITVVCTTAQRFYSSVIAVCSIPHLFLLLTTLSISLLFSFSPFSTGTCLGCVSPSTSCFHRLLHSALSLQPHNTLQPPLLQIHFQLVVLEQDFPCTMPPLYLYNMVCRFSQLLLEIFSIYEHT